MTPAVAHRGLLRHVVEVDPLAVPTCNDALCTQDHTVLFAVVELLENVLDLVLRELAGRLGAPACEHLVGMMMVVMIVIVSTAAIVIMVMMIVVMMIVIAVIMIVVMVIMVTMVVIVMVMVIVVTMVVIMIVIFMIFKQALNLSSFCQCMADRLSSKFIPWSGDDGCFCIFLTKCVHALFYLFICHHLGTADNDRRCMLYLVIEEFSEVLEIDLCFLTVNNCDSSVNLNICLIFDTLDCFYNIRKLSNS